MGAQTPASADEACSIVIIAELASVAIEATWTITLFVVSRKSPPGGRSYCATQLEEHPFLIQLCGCPSSRAASER